MVLYLLHVFLQVIEKGMRFTMRDGKCTLGYGVVTDMLDKVDIVKFEDERKKEKKARVKAEEAQNLGY